MERTCVEFKSDFNKIKPNHHLLFLGSCFSENIGLKFLNSKFNAVVSPIGTVFHPVAIANLLERSLQERIFTEEDFFYFDGYYFNYELSQDFAHYEIDMAVKKANSLLVDLKSNLIKSDKLFITLGSAVEYKLLDSNKIVANCHKQSLQNFSKKISDVITIKSALQSIFQQLKQLNSKLEIMITVSPVRHKKEGVVEDRLSKSMLIVAAHELAGCLDNTFYVPVYEYFIDELRDYSFCKEDLVHPNKKGVNKIWQKIALHTLTDESARKVQEWNKIENALNHKILRPKSNSAKLFLKNTLAQIEKFEVHWNSLLVEEKQKVLALIKSLE